MKASFFLKENCDAFLVGSTSFGIRLDKSSGFLCGDWVNHHMTIKHKDGAGTLVDSQIKKIYQKGDPFEPAHEATSTCPLHGPCCHELHGNTPRALNSSSKQLNHNKSFSGIECQLNPLKMASIKQKQNCSLFSDWDISVDLWRHNKIISEWYIFTNKKWRQFCC